MTLRNPLRTFDHKIFLSMINKDDGQVIPDFHATNIENWLIRDRGELVMRDGLTAKGTSPSATNLGAAQLVRQNVKYLVRVIDGAADSAKIQHSTNGTTWTDVSGGGSLKSGQNWVFAQANEFLYGVNGSDTPIKYNGSTVTTVAAIPVGTSIAWWRNHMFVGGVSANPDRLYFSNDGDPETWGGSDFININLGDGSAIVGLIGLGGSTGRLLIGKSRSVWYLTGFDSTDFAVSHLTYEHGIASHESMVEVGNQVWGIDNEGNVRGLYRTGEDVPFTALKSRDIQETVAGLNKSSLDKSSAIYFDNYAMFFVPNGVDSHNSLVMVWDTLANEKNGGWLLFTGWTIARATIFNQSQPQLYLHDSRSGNGQTYQWTGTSDNGIAIIAKYETKIYDHGVPERRKRWSYAYQFAPTVGDDTVRFYTSIDRYYYTLIKTFALSGTGDAEWDSATWDVSSWTSEGTVRQKVRYTEGGGENKGYAQQVKLEAESTTTKMKLRKFTSHFRVLGLR